MLSPIALAVCVAAAQADDSSVNPQLESVLVYGSAYRHTATKSSLEPNETPQGISVIDREVLDMRAVDSINEALRYVSGVTTELRGGAVTRLDQFTIRGFQNYQNSYDGLQLLYNEWNLQPQIDSVAIEQVEVFKGPTSVLYGSMPPGGLVNLIAKSPSTQTYHSVNVSAGSHHLKEISAESKGQLGQSDFSYSVVALARDKEGQAVTSEEERYVFAPSLDWQVSDQTLINFNLYYQNDPSAGIYNTIPAKGSLFKNPHGEMPVDIYAGDANWNTYEREVALVGYKINHEFTDNWTFLQNTRYLKGDVYQENTYNSGYLGADTELMIPADRYLYRRAYLTDETSEGITVDNQLSGRIKTGVVEHNMLVGIDLIKLESGIKYYDIATSPIDLFAPNNYLLDLTKQQIMVQSAVPGGGYVADFELEKEQLGVYLQNQMRIDKLIVIAGARYDDYEYTEQGMQYGYPVDSKVKQHSFSHRVGALYEFEFGLSPYISYATSFEPVSGSDRNGNEFEPATSSQWEAGLKYTHQKNISLTLSGFEITKKNDTTRDPSGSPYDKIQTGEVRSRGVELEVAAQPSDNISVLFNYTFIDMEVTKNNDGLKGKTPIWVADKTASLWASYEATNGFLDGTEVGVGIRFVGETQLDALNTDTVPAYTLVDLSLAYKLGELSASLDGAKIILSANNILDKRYYSCYDSNNCWFGSERSVEASLKFEF
ncbi:MAG: TonB-dependent siderophore receptor [Spongiibacteraceae bacterium]|nr:TonB-dependent siderophore receptor [Spongiibacteraceae bacterium]